MTQACSSTNECRNMDCKSGESNTLPCCVNGRCVCQTAACNDADAGERLGGTKGLGYILWGTQTRRIVTISAGIAVAGAIVTAVVLSSPSLRRRRNDKR